MGTLDHDKKSKKRKRSKSLDQSLTDERETDGMCEKDIGGESPEQKPSKKRKKDEQNDSLLKKSPKLSKTKNTSNTSDFVVPEKNIKKANRKTAEDTSVKQSKTKQKGKMAEDQTVNDVSLKRETRSKKKEEKLIESEDVVHTEEIVEKENPTTVKKKKNKKDKKASFGVVNADLLEKSGGVINSNEKKATEKPSRINLAVDHLHLWHTKRTSWKFNKNFQWLLIKAAYNPIIITEDDFETLLLYLQECKGNCREKLRTDAMALIKESDDHLAEPVDADMEKRARAILQMLG